MIVRPAVLKRSIRSQSCRRACGSSPVVRLVEEQQVGLAHQRAGHRQPLPLPARELAHPRAALLPELHHRDHLGDFRPAKVETAEQPKRLFDRQLLGELGLLQLHAEPLAQLGAVGLPAQSQQFDRPGVGLEQPLADLDGGGLPRPVRSQQSEALARARLEIDPVHRNHVRVGLPQAAHRQREHQLGRGHYLQYFPSCDAAQPRLGRIRLRLVPAAHRIPPDMPSPCIDEQRCGW